MPAKGLNMTLEIHVQVASSPGPGDKANVHDKSVHKITMKVIIWYTPKYERVNSEKIMITDGKGILVQCSDRHQWFGIKDDDQGCINSKFSRLIQPRYVFQEHPALPLLPP